MAIEFDLSIGILGIIPIPFITFVPSISLGNEAISSHATTKGIKYPAILKSQTVLMDGLYSKTENLVFSASTGAPVITKTYDGYYDKAKIAEKSTTGEIYTLSIPAEYIYSEMGQKSKNSNNTNQLTPMAINITTYGSKPFVDWQPNGPILNAIGASTTTYENDWSTSWADQSIINTYGDLSGYTGKLNKTWRPKSNYVYKSEMDYTSTPENALYNSGYFNIDGMFNFEYLNANENWLKISEITKYSPNGNPLEEVDIMNIPSSVLYGKQYGNNLPTMIAYNSSNSDIFFYDFEGTGEGVTTDKSHSGYKSKIVSDGANIISNVTVSDNLSEKGAVLKFWLSTQPYKDASPVVTVNSEPVTLNRVASTGEWTLFNCVIGQGVIGSARSQLTVQISNLPAGAIAFIDDLRFQPFDAMSTCYVYDVKTFKLLTQFDDQHFGMYYKYNEEGTLTHKLVETERGLKTIQETQYNTPKVSRQ